MNRFTSAIDHGYEAGHSVVLRYRNALRLEPNPEDDRALKEHLGRTTIREGLRIVPLLEHRGVTVDVLDESSWMHTSTLKSIDGCVTAAHCLKDGDRAIVFESGGNTGTALTAYGVRAGLETHFVVPEENLTILDREVFAPDGAHLVAVADPRDVKGTAIRLARRLGARHVPEPDWRFQSSMFIGCYLLENWLQRPGYDHLVQSISAAFAPIGIYRVLRDHAAGLGSLPAFLGIQQQANCPMVKRWCARPDEPPAAPVPSTGGLLNRVMYDAEPQSYGTYSELEAVLKETAGDLRTVDHRGWDQGLARDLSGADLLTHLARRGIDIALRDGQVIEKAGIMALIGALEAIDAGEIASGARLLVCLTGGTGCPDGLARPDHSPAVAGAGVGVTG